MSARQQRSRCLGEVSLLSDEGLVDVGDDSSSGDGRLDQRVQLLVASDGELEMAGGDTLHLQVLAGVAGQLEHLEEKEKI